MNSKLNKLWNFYTLKHGSYIYTVKRPVCPTHNFEVIVMFWKKHVVYTHSVDMAIILPWAVNNAQLWHTPKSWAGCPS